MIKNIFSRKILSTNIEHLIIKYYNLTSNIPNYKIKINMNMNIFPIKFELP